MPVVIDRQIHWQVSGQCTSVRCAVPAPLHRCSGGDAIDRSAVKSQLAAVYCSSSDIPIQYYCGNLPIYTELSCCEMMAVCH